MENSFLSISVYLIRLSFHSPSGNQNYTCAQNKYCTKDVEKGCTHAAGGRKSRTRIILNSYFYSTGCRIKFRAITFNCPCTLFLTSLNFTCRSSETYCNAN